HRRYAHARDAHAGADEETRRRARPGVRPAVSEIHDPAPHGCHPDGAAPPRRARRGAGPGRVPVRVRRERGPDHGDRPYAEDARRVRCLLTSRNPTMRSGLSSIAVAMGVLTAAGCASSHAAATPSPTPSASSVDARVGLSAGWWNAGEAIWNLRKVSENKPAPPFLPKNPAG